MPHPHTSIKDHTHLEIKCHTHHTKPFTQVQLVRITTPHALYDLIIYDLLSMYLHEGMINCGSVLPANPNLVYLEERGRELII